MTDKVGIFRHAERLRKRSRTCRDAAAVRAISACGVQAPGANPELVAAYRLAEMLKLAQCVAYGALQRTESRGAHYRADSSSPRRPRLAAAHPRHVAGDDA